MSEPHDRPPDGRPWQALVGLLAVIVLIAVVFLVMRKLQSVAQLQDCVASGRTNCVTLDGTAR